MSVTKERAQRIKEICNAINVSPHGGENNDAVLWLGSGESAKTERFPTGSPALDEAMGGGYPRGRFIELFGPESGGKSTLALHAIAEFQKKYPDEDVGLIDVEYSMEEAYARAIGVDTEVLLLHQPESGEQALNVLKLMITLGVKLIIVDSVAALTTTAEVKGDLGDIHVATQARLMSQSLKQLASIAGRNKATVIWTNQIRAKIGVTWGDKTTTPGGQALGFYSSVRAHIARISSEKVTESGKEIAISNRVKVQIKKNKVSPPFRVAEFIITFGHGIDSVAEVFDLAVENGVVSKSGAWFSFGDARLGQGRQKVIEGLREDEELLGGISARLTKAKEAKEAKTKGKEAVSTSTALGWEGNKAIKRVPVEGMEALTGEEVEVNEV